MSSLVLVFAVLAILLAVALIPFNLRQRRIMRAAAAASASQLEHIYQLVERTGSIASNGYILARTNETNDNPGCLIPIPAGLPDFPWAGKTIEVTRTDDVAFRFVDAAPAQPSLSGKVCRPLQVPRHQTTGTGQGRNAFAPEKYLAASEELEAALKQVCPGHPKELLSYLLCAGGESGEFEPIDQARIGASAAWAQSPKHQDCDVCGKRMTLVLQLPGTTIDRKHFHSGMFYLFGCVRHPEQLKSVVQHT
ncbi:hypothetical protein [Massilia sp. AB1]|uniref:hypothetical protein n=1 Tax=Massilia sp. AB1 TaxID=2823371 RepID=UPI001B81A3B8|nr:hypothetical protein [Massilia sp. AB1]MBQ5939116.1 hypothetical protein [Massilia sp. AB1]